MISPPRYVLAKEKDYFLETLSMLVSSGMGLLEALDSIALEVRSKSMRRLILWMKDQIDAGSPLWKALSVTHLFAGHTISLLRIGEQAGRLAQNLHLIGLQQEKERSFRSKIRSAMLYPIFVLTLTGVVGIAIAWFLLPRLALVFSQLRLELPLFTKILIGSGTFLSIHGTIVLPIFILSIFLLIYGVFFFSKTKIIGQKLVLFLPGISQLIREVELARFSYLLGTLLEAGLPVVDAIHSLEQATSFTAYKKFYQHLKKSVEDSNSFQRSFSSYKGVRRLIPLPIQHMIIAGEKSGSLSAILLRINETYESRIEDTTKNLAVILEPILLVCVWLGVMVVALAVILPIYSLIGQFNVQ